MTRKPFTVAAGAALALGLGIGLAALPLGTAAARTLASIQSRGSIILCANPNFMPFASKKGERHGIEVDLADALARELGVGLELGWVITRYDIRRTDCDIVLDAIDDPELQAEHHLKLSHPYNQSGVAIALRPGVNGIHSFDDLKKGMRIGAIVGSLISYRLGMHGVPTSPFTFEDDMVEALGHGEIDEALVTPATIGYYNLTHKNAPLSMVPAYQSWPEFRWAVAVGMHNPDEALIRAVNQALDKLIAQGTVHQIYASYGVDQSLPRQ